MQKFTKCACRPDYCTQAKKIQDHLLIFRYITEDKDSQVVNFINRVLLIEENLSRDYTDFHAQEILTYDEIKQKGGHESCSGSCGDIKNSNEDSEGEGEYSNSGAIFDKNGSKTMGFGDLVKKNGSDNNNKYFWSLLRLKKDFGYVLDLNSIESQPIGT